MSHKVCLHIWAPFTRLYQDFIQRSCMFDYNCLRFWTGFNPPGSLIPTLGKTRVNTAACRMLMTGVKVEYYKHSVENKHIYMATTERPAAGVVQRPESFRQCWLLVKLSHRSGCIWAPTERWPMSSICELVWFGDSWCLLHIWTDKCGETPDFIVWRSFGVWCQGRIVSCLWHLLK